MSKKLTTKQLGQILYEEFDRDDWGMIDPFYFNDAEDDDDEMNPYEVLERATERINKLLDK